MAVIYIVILILNLGLCLGCTEGINDELLKRIKDLEDKETINAARIYHLESKVKDNNDKFEILQTENINLKNDLAIKTNKLDQLERVIVNLNYDMTRLKQASKNEQVMVKELNEKVIQTQKAQTTFVKALQSCNTALVEHADSISNSSDIEAVSQFKIQNGLSNIRANYSTTKDSIPLIQTNETSIVPDSNLNINRSHTIKWPGIIRQTRQQNFVVAFHAVLAARQLDHLGADENIKFDHVHLNAGGGYHYQHGLFIAPRSGIYLFSSNVASTTGNHFWADLVKNGQNLASFLAEDELHINQGSVTAVTQLTAGDEVWVRHTHPTDGPIWGEYYSSFCGVLLIPQ